MSYTLKFPFRLPAGQDIGGLDKPFKTSVYGLSWLVERKLENFVVTVVGLGSEEECHEYSKRMWSGFNWLLLRRKVAPIATLEFDLVTYSEDPEEAARNLEKGMGLPYSGPVHGLAGDSMLAAYPSDMNIRFVGVGNATMTVTTPVADVVNAIAEGIEIRAEPPTVEDRKLQVALDLFAAYWLESTDNARLMTLIMALESLMTHPPRHDVVVELLETWQSEMEHQKQRFAKDSEEFLALESLERELVLKKTDSLRRQVRSLVLESLEFLGEEEAEDKAREAVWIYDQRSTLVHEGELPQPDLGKVTSGAKEIVEKVLEARFRGFRGDG